MRTLITDDEETLLVVHKTKHEEAGIHENIALAAMTTAYARIALYKVPFLFQIKNKGLLKIIRQYPQEVVYFDTDSVFILLPPGREPPPTSTVLGGLKDEIMEEHGPEASISSFHSIGPKSYTYRLSSILCLAQQRISSVEKGGAVIKEEMKLKGVSFNSEAAKTVNPTAMQGLTTNRDKHLLAPQYLIRKDLFKTKLWNSTIYKRVQFQSKKRWFLPGRNPTMDTLPYGYCFV